VVVSRSNEERGLFRLALKGDVTVIAEAIAADAAAADTADEEEDSDGEVIASLCVKSIKDEEANPVTPERRRGTGLITEEGLNIVSDAEVNDNALCLLSS